MPPPTQALPEGIYRVSDGAPLEPSVLWEELSDARFVLVGETHDSEFDHFVQHVVADTLAERGPVVIGMEMFQRPFQEALDAYVAGDLDEAELLAATEWEKRWGFSTEMYRPFWEIAREHQVPLVALNARRELTKRIARVGVEGLTEVERADLPELDLSSQRHRAWMRGVFEAHGSVMEPSKFERFYQAQVTWDETMAETAVEAARRHPDHQVLVFAGRGHVERDFGIPSRIRRRTDERVVSIVPIEEDPPTFDWMRRERFADYVWVGGASRR